MPTSKAFWTGITGVAVFILTTAIGGFVHPNYSHTAQFISELYAVDAPHANALRYFGYIPSGLLLLLFSFFAVKEAPKSATATIGFIGLGLAYGLGTVICGFFNCDAGCNPEFINPTLSQIVHNLMGFLTYMLTPIAIFITALGMRKWKNGKVISKLGLVLAFTSFCFAGVLNSDLNSPYKGMTQRLIEGSILLWIAACAFYLQKKYNADAPVN